LATAISSASIPAPRGFAVLHRKTSKHNAFLVTERCNHYCLMCSQPPRNIDDGWILDEIEECIELIDPATKTIGLPGGEPLLE
jgi:MoaA/NifB/PqqE/SkfB family radical SAM enzyme